MKVIILRGLPGSGKSFYCRQLEKSEATYVVSADHFFMRNNKYEFEPSKIGMAHKACMADYNSLIYNLAQDAEDSLRRKTYLVVDNTNTQLWEMAFYVGLAQVYDIPFELHYFKCSVETSARRNTHGVPIESIRRMNERFQGRGNIVGPGWPQTVIETEQIK